MCCFNGNEGVIRMEELAAVIQSLNEHPILRCLQKHGTFWVCVFYNG